MPSKTAPIKPRNLFSEDAARRIGEQIRTLREQAQISQSELARRCEVSESAISRLESGDRMPRTITVLRISQALGVSASRLLKGAGL